MIFHIHNNHSNTLTRFLGGKTLTLLLTISLSAVDLVVMKDQKFYIANVRYPLYSWVDWSDVSSGSCSRKQLIVPAEY